MERRGRSRTRDAISLNLLLSSVRGVLVRRRLVIAVIVLALLLAAGAAIYWVATAQFGPKFVFSVAGDFGSWNGFTEGLRQLNKTGSDFAFALGDLSYGGKTEQAWCAKFRETFVNVGVLAGNHDTGAPPYLPDGTWEGNINNYTESCPFPLNAPLTGDYGKQYYFDYPSMNPIARFVLISPDLVFAVDNGEHYNYSVGSPRYTWTAKAIDGARSAGVPWVIVGMHKNCIAAGEHECEIGPDLLNLLIEKKVDLILQAHTHNYERSKQLVLNSGSCPAINEHVYIPACVAHDGADGQYRKGDGAVLVISGTGGRDLDSFNSSNPLAQYFAARMDNATVGNGKGVVTFTVEPSRITMRTSFNGTYTDGFAIAQSVDVLANLENPLALALVGSAVVVVASAVLWNRSRRKRRGWQPEE